MGQPYDLRGTTIYVEGVVTRQGKKPELGGPPTKDDLDELFGADVRRVGESFVGTLNAGEEEVPPGKEGEEPKMPKVTNSYVVWTANDQWFYAAGTEATPAA